MPLLVRRLAKECAAASVDSDRFAAALTARWGARLSALLIRGNAAVHRACRAALGVAPRPWSGEAGPLPHSLPEGECNYELLCFASAVRDDV